MLELADQIVRVPQTPTTVLIPRRIRHRGKELVAPRPSIGTRNLRDHPWSPSTSTGDRPTPHGIRSLRAQAGGRFTGLARTRSPVSRRRTGATLPGRVGDMPPLDAVKLLLVPLQPGR